MNTHRARSTLLAFLTCAATVTTPVHAVTYFGATLNGMQDVPPFPEVTATGTAFFVLNDAQNQLSFDISYSGLTGPEIASHIHNAGPRDNGPIRFTLPPGTHKVGVWNIPAAMVTELFAKRLYINVHTDAYLPGEIRGNIMQQQVPTEPSTWGRIKALFRSP